MELKDNLYNQIESLSEKGNEAMENERYDEAISFFQQAYNLLPAPKEEWEAYTWIMVSIGDAYFSKQKYQSSLECFRKCYNNGDVDNPFILLRIGENSLELNDSEMAKEFLLRAYMLEGKKIFKHESKFLQWLSNNVELKKIRKKNTQQEIIIKQSSPDNDVTPACMESSDELNNQENQWLNKVVPFSRKQEYDEVLKISKHYWGMLPEPKMTTEFSYHLVNTLTITYLKMEQFDMALHWAKVYDTFDFASTGRIDSGEKDYYVAIAYYENGVFEKAQEYFSIANKKSKGRCFQLLFGDKYKKVFKGSV